MRFSSRIVGVLWLALVAMFCRDSPLWGQPISIGVPSAGVSDSYFENFGVGFGFSIPGGTGPGSRVVGLSPSGQLMPNLMFQNSGLGGTAVPGFSAANGGGSFGWNVRGRNGGGFSLGFNWVKGSQRSSVLNAPSLTVQNGFGGSIASGQITPFVTGVVPVVGQSSLGPRRVDNAVTRAIESGALNSYSPRPAETSNHRTLSAAEIYGTQQSSATRGDSSVAAIKAARAQSLAIERQRVERKLQEARILVDQGDLSMARSKFREAWRMTEDETLRHSIKSEIAATR